MAASSQYCTLSSPSGYWHSGLFHAPLVWHLLKFLCEMREGHLGRETDYIGSETAKCWHFVTHNSALLLLKIWHKGQYFLWVSKSTSVRMILHQRHSNKASLDIFISTSQGTCTVTSNHLPCPYRTVTSNHLPCPHRESPHGDEKFSDSQTAETGRKGKTLNFEILSQ